MNHPIPNTKDSLSCQVIIPQNQVGRKSGEEEVVGKGGREREGREVTNFEVKCIQTHDTVSTPLLLLTHTYTQWRNVDVLCIDLDLRS